MQARAAPGPANRFSRDTKHGFYRPVTQAAREPRPPRPPGFWVTKHETRITNHGFFDTKHGFLSRNVARMVHVGTEALQSCFFCPGLLGNSTGRRSPCGSRIRASQAFTDRNPLILRPLRNTNHETRVTAFMFFTNHESRNTNHGFVFFTKHGTRNMVSMVHVGTEALQSFFSVQACVA